MRTLLLSICFFFSALAPAADLSAFLGEYQGVDSHGTSVVVEVELGLKDGVFDNDLLVSLVYPGGAIAQDFITLGSGRAHAGSNGRVFETTSHLASPTRLVSVQARQWWVGSQRFLIPWVQRAYEVVGQGKDRKLVVSERAYRWFGWSSRPLGQCEFTLFTAS